MRRFARSVLLGIGTGLVLLASAGRVDGPVGAAELYAPQTLDQ